VAKHLDKEAIGKVVRDQGSVIAVWKETEQADDLTVGKVRNAVSTKWGIERRYVDIESDAKAIGRKVTTEKKIARRKIRQ